MDDETQMTDHGRMIARARRDPTVFVRLYRKYYDAVFRYCVHRLFERAAAEDITSDVFLKDAVLALKPRYQTIITLRFFENLKLTEIAEVLASSPGTVRSQLARALGQLRKVLGTKFAEESEVIKNGQRRKTI